MALVAVVLVAATACTGTWGIRSSYRTYVTGFIGQGEIVASDGATWMDGPGTGKGPFQWTIASSSFDAGTETGTIQFSGGVSTAAHPSAEGYVLDTSFWNPRLEIDGDEGTLYVDLNYRPFESTEPEELPALQVALDVPFATLDLAGEDWTPNGNGLISITDAPAVGVTATMELIGWDDFYGDPVALDPFSVSFFAHAPSSLAETPDLVVTETEDLHPGDTVIVYGSGFDPAANVGTRPPLSGQLSGNYAVFGRFPTVWQPSAGVLGSARTVITQRWALPEPSYSTLNPTGTNAAYVELEADGTFTAVLTVAEGGTSGNYGIYTYGGAGAVNAAHELAVPITFAS
jgi:hypothetical protein